MKQEVGDNAESQDTAHNEASTSCVIVAPLSGQIIALEDVSDPVFSKKMVGDGIAIDPLNNVLFSPCDGRVTRIHPAGHAITVLSQEGIEILMHVGIDTVALKGEGFTPKAQKGSEVVIGTPLIEFDMDFLATHAKSLVTLIVVPNSNKVSSFAYASGMVDAGKEPILSLLLAGGAVTHSPEEKRVLSHAVVISNPLGLHAQHSEHLAEAARSFKSEIQVYVREHQADAKNNSSLLALNVGQGTKVMLSAWGPDSEEAITSLTALLEDIK